MLAIAALGSSLLNATYVIKLDKNSSSSAKYVTILCSLNAMPSS